MPRIVAFDIGIKNLAFCILDGTVIRRLENTNILPSVASTSCVSCSAKASVSAGSNTYCKRHIPKTFTIIQGKSNMADLKTLAKAHDISTTKKTKADLVTALSSIYAFPYIQPKQPKAAAQSLADLHDALHTFVDSYWHDFSTCTHILLENQPAFKNPHMKSVQVLLFAVLRERFIHQSPIPPFHLIHAKKKVKDATAGDAGYADRKSKSEERVHELLRSNTISPASSDILTSWMTAKKKSDMADSACMCYDFLATHK